VPRSKKGQAISARRRTPEQLQELDDLISEADALGDLKLWRRAMAVRGYLDGKRVIQMCQELGVSRGGINQWLLWYEAEGAVGLRTRKSPGAAPRLTEALRAELTAIIEAGPQVAGFRTGLWTGPMVGELIGQRYGVHYHIQHIPRLLHQMGFSVQRPRKRLARADAQAQKRWLEETLPRIKKKPLPVAAG
jgi:transposase